jgi:hypothetical protein
MASLAEQSFSLFPQQQEEYSHFAEASHGPVYSSAPMDLNIAADAYVSYVQRAPSQEHYSTSPSTISFEYTTDPASASAYMMNNGPTSPGMYGDDYLSSLSTGSASSSAVGSPLSNHGQAGMDWAVQGLGIQPTIAGEYVDFTAFSHGLEDVSPFDFSGLAHAKSFVGKFYSACVFLHTISALFSSCLSLRVSPPTSNSKVAACSGRISSLGCQ